MEEAATSRGLERRWKAIWMKMRIASMAVHHARGAVAASSVGWKQCRACFTTKGTFDAFPASAWFLVSHRV
jgi:hypothetical protein